MGRCGLDCRAILSPIFTTAIRQQFQARVMQASEVFVKGIPAMKLSSSILANVPTYEGGLVAAGGCLSSLSSLSWMSLATVDAAQSAQMPLNLTSHLSLATLTNNLLFALNELRE